MFILTALRLALSAFLNGVVQLFEAADLSSKYHDQLDEHGDSKHALIISTLLLGVLVTNTALAADGALCAECATERGSIAYLLCDSKTDAGTVTGCGPIVLPMGGVSNTIVRFVKLEPLCSLPVAVVQETDDLTPDANTVWFDVGTITGGGSGEVGMINPNRAVGPVVRLTFASDITDTDCDDIDFVARPIFRKD